MAKLATLIDDFQDNVIDGTKWSTSGTVAETGGRARLTPTVSFSFWGTPARTYDLSASSVTAHIPVITANGSTGTLQSGIVVDKDANNLIGMRKVGSQLICTKSVAGIETQLSFTPYNAVNHLFWRIRADATNIYWETSATGSGAFFIQNTASIASLGFAITVVGFYLYSGYSGDEAFPGTFQVEAINPGLPVSGSGASTSTGTLALVVIGPVQLTASGASTSSGSLSILAVSDLDLTASGVSTSTGTFAFTIIPAGTLSFSASGASTSTGSLIFSAGATVLLTGSGASTSTGTLSLSVFNPSTVSGTWYFEPPVALDLPPTLPEPTRPRYLNAHAKWKGGQRRGRSVLKHGSVYTIVDTPTVDQMAAADIAYQGGHIYEVTAAEAYALFLAGFNVYHGTDLLTTESGDFITTESGDLLQVEYSLGLS